MNRAKLDPIWIEVSFWSLIFLRSDSKYHQIVCALKHEWVVSHSLASQSPLFHDQQHLCSVPGLKIFFKISLVQETEERKDHFTWDGFLFEVNNSAFILMTQFIKVWSLPSSKWQGQFPKTEGQHPSTKKPNCTAHHHSKFLFSTSGELLAIN